MRDVLNVDPRAPSETKPTRRKREREREDDLDFDERYKSAR